MALCEDLKSGKQTLDADARNGGKDELAEELDPDEVEIVSSLRVFCIEIRISFVSHYLPNKFFSVCSKFTRRSGQEMLF